MTKRALRLGSVVAGVAMTGAASGENTPRVIVDTYDVIGGCPDEAAFRAEIERRVHARTSTPMHVVLHVEQQPRNIDGSVEVIDANGGRSRRKVSSTQCAEIVSAAALVVALAIDDAAESAPATKPAPTTPTGDVTPTVAPLTIDTSRKTSPRSTVKDDDLVFRAGLQGALQVGVSPNATASLPLFVELGGEKRAAGFHVEPRARLAWTFAAPSQGEVAAGTAQFSWMSGALDLCPVRFALATRDGLPFLDLRTCGRLELGRLAAEGEGTASATQSDRRVWVGAAAPVTFRIEPPGLGGFFLEAEAGPRVPFLRDRFTVGPSNSLVFQPPPVGLTAGIGAGIAFR